MIDQQQEAAFRDWAANKLRAIADALARPRDDGDDVTARVDKVTIETEQRAVTTRADVVAYIGNDLCDVSVQVRERRDTRAKGPA